MSGFEDGFYFGAGFVASQFLFILIVSMIILAGYGIGTAISAFRRKRKAQKETQLRIYPVQKDLQ